MSLWYLNACRLCASSCVNYIPIFNNGSLGDFAKKIKCYLHVEISNPNDANEKPKMCSDCCQKIVKWDQYAEQVHKVQGMFMSLTAAPKSDNLSKIVHNDESPNKDKTNIFQSSNENVETKEYISNNNSFVENCQLPEKHKVKNKTVIKIRKKKNFEFSDEDDIPLVNQLDTLKSAQDPLEKKVKEKKKKKVKPRIKLKIKPIQKKLNETTSLKNCNTDIEEKNSEEQQIENDLATDDDDDDEKVENKIKDRNEFQSLLTWECVECHSPVKNWNALVKHCRETHNTNASVQCVCGKFLQSRASIVKHRMKHTIGYGYKCEFENCNKTFHRQQLLDVHTLSHMPKELQPWMCCKCSRRFHTESLLKQHEKVHLPKEEKLIHPCEVCHKKFCSKSAVSAHIRAVHFGERPFVCDQCGHSFTSKGILHEHLTIHSDVYNFHCKDCNKSFKTKYRLKIHMDTHVETRYQCPKCTLTLNTRRTLRMHLLVHKDDKAFQCTTCGKAFKRSKDLKNHYNLHTGRRPYTCPFCQRTFANGSNCRSHKRRMHPEELKIYEASLKEGQQQPITFGGEGRVVERTAHLEQNLAEEFLEDSNESKSHFSDLKCDKLKYSDDEIKPVSLLFYKSDNNKVETNQNVDKFNMSSPCAIPLNLQRNYQRIKEEDKNEGDLIVLDEEENVTTNLSQIPFTTQSLNDGQYQLNNLYTYQSSGIPAFPGNPFYPQ